MPRKTKALVTIGWLALLVGILLHVIFSTAMNRNFYFYEYDKGNQAEVIGMSDEDLMKATDTLLDYLKDKRDDIRLEATVSGYEREVFNERETLHMKDVKVLYQHASLARWILLIAGAGILIAEYFLNKGYNRIRLFRSGYHYALCFIGIFVGFILIWAVADFYDFWMDFHYLFFDNDLFILDPNTSIMINMFPETFFSDLVLLIIAIYGSVLVVMELVMFFIQRKKVKA
ncbi:MAG: TIGR01906 family membrane protein [Erysipelotrichaceae bacterium]|jgi:integral membrane protein (TIGR01906 family)|nr:TIGR01906 family membrane protein [Erysipelotrichaceae bacterium]